MKLFRIKAPSPAGSASDLSPQGEARGHMALRSDTSPSRGEVARRSRVGEGDFVAKDCAIWNDIRRALEAK